MRLFKLEYTLTGDLQLAASPFFEATPQASQRFLSILLANDLEQAKAVVLARRSDDQRGRLWNPRLSDLTFTDYYAATVGSPEEIVPLSNQRPLLIGTDQPQEIHVARL